LIPQFNIPPTAGFPAVGGEFCAVNMPDFICLAARFDSQDQAGRVYSAIHEMLRASRESDLSVYRFELGGVPHVAVVGLEPSAHILQGVGQALAGGQPVTLAQEAVLWLLERRADMAPEGPGFTEGHYTQGTGPRFTAPGTGVRRRRVATLEVTWQDQVPGRGEAAGTVTDLRTGSVYAIPARHSGVCDWCTAELASPVAAIHNFAVELEFPDGFTTGTGGRWATCSMCQDRLKLKPGDTRVPFDAVDRLWRLHGARYLGEHIHRVRVRTFYQEGSPYT
jgi:hypothetical protein